MIFQLSQRGQELEVRALLRNTRHSLNAAYEQLDPNMPEADELARMVTELRRSIDRLGPHGVKDWENDPEAMSCTCDDPDYGHVCALHDS